MAGYKRTFSFHEKRDAENVIKNGFTDGITNGKEAQVVAKYYREIHGYGEVRIERAIIKFCKENDPSFNAILEAESISHWVKNAMEFPLRKAKPIVITHSEMKEIKKVRNLDNRKILFVTLVMVKAIKSASTSPQGSKYYLHYDTIPLVINELEKKITEIEFADIVHDFISLGLMTLYKPQRQSLLINFANDEGSVAIKLLYPSEAVERYKSFFGGDIKLCANGCGTEIVKTGNKTKYCPDCAKEINIKKTMENRKKRSV